MQNIDIRKIVINCLGIALMLILSTSMAFAAKGPCDAFIVSYPGCLYEPVATCTLCPLFTLVFNTVSKIGSLSAQYFSPSIVIVVVVFFAVWLAIECLRFVSSIKTKDLKDLVQKIINTGFVLLLVITILKTGVGNFYSAFVMPVYNTGLTISQTMLDNCKGSSKGCNAEDSKVKRDPSIAMLESYKDGLPLAMGENIIKTMTMMQNRIKKTKTVGASFMRQSIKPLVRIIFPRIRLLLFGLVI